MLLRRAVALAFCLAVCGLAVPPLGASPAAARGLTFEERVRAARAIEQVSYAHLVGAARPFDEAVPSAILERKVRVSLQESVALAEIWRTPVTAAALRAEMRRIRAQTRLPDRLREIEEALGHDEFLLEECYARPILVDRLMRGFYSSDPERAGSVAGRSWDEWWEGAQERFDPRPAEAVAREHQVPAPPPVAARPATVPMLSAASGAGRDAAIAPFQSPFTCGDENSWFPLNDDGPPDPGAAPAVWTGSEMIFWGGFDSRATSGGGRYDPVTDTWSAVSSVGAPSKRSGHTLVWTGNEMIAWGGTGEGSVFNNGGRYDPITDTWSPISVTGAPSARSAHTAVWTGQQMVVWGGAPSGSFGSPVSTGGRYDPASDTWTPVSQTNVPSARTGHTAVWTGSRMIVWGGAGTSNSSSFVNTGGRYDPVNDSWAPTNPLSAPGPRYAHVAVWTGSAMVIWGGYLTGWLDTGGRYDPVTDTWQPTTMTNVPAARRSATGVFVGGRVVIWGGDGSGPFVSGPLNTGARYDPVADAWQPTSQVGAPPKGSGNLGVAAGSLMIVWGNNAGGRYDPSTDTWTPVSIGSAPAARFNHTAVWTGREMIIWGGDSSTASLDTGGRWDPVSATWTPTSTLNAPSGRGDHTAVWTGREMIVWGGSGAAGRLDTGGRYDPLTDTWLPTSMTGAPAGRSDHTAVWTGDRMIVWGGIHGAVGSSERVDTGGRYDPATDTWLPTSTIGTPGRHSSHVAVWTGSKMVVFGGHAASGYDTSGGRYDPATDSWSPISTVGAPPGQDESTAVWTGREMVVWGGSQFEDIYTNVGGRYDPGLDVWRPTSLSGAPSLRAGHAAVWTGYRMTIWGGRAGSASATGGAQYDPVGNRWEPITATGAPSVRFWLTGVWTGEQMIVWGGLRNQVLASGGAYIPNGPPDQDGDGFRMCDGDCDDHDAAVHPGAVEACGAGRDLDCDGVATPLDTTPPTFSAAAIPAMLWPPTHQMVPVHVGWQVTDDCDDAPVVTLLSATSNEPDDAPGNADGFTPGDIAGADLGTADTDLLLRAERSAWSGGRIYRLEYQAVDAHGNTARVFVLVTVPRDQRRWGRPGGRPPGTGGAGTPGWTPAAPDAPAPPGGP